MKKLVLSCLCVLGTFGLFAQSNEEILKQDPCKAACSFYVYDYKTVQEMTPAPEGYLLSLQADGPYAAQVSAPESASGAHERDFPSDRPE